MELETVLEAEGVKTLEELKAKIKADAEKAALGTSAEKEAGLVKQIADLEAIKATQGDEVGTLRKDLEEAKEQLDKIEEKKTKNAEIPAEKTEEQLKQENEAVEEALTNDQWKKLEGALKDADADTRKLALSSEEGRASFRNAILGSSETLAQETFRRPIQEKKLTVDEKIRIGLGLLKPNTAHAVRSTGSGFSPDRQTNNKKPASFEHPFVASGSIRDRIKARKEE